MDIEQRTSELGQQCYCCSQIIIKIGLEFKGEDNDAMVQAMRGLCRGLHTQRLCGALSAGACLLSLFSEEQASELVSELTKWFEERFGSLDCAELIGIGQRNLQKCMEITSDTCTCCFELLDEKGLLET